MRTTHIPRAVSHGLWLAVTLATTSCAITDEPSPQPETRTATSAVTAATSLAPTSDVANDHVWGGGGTAPIYALVDDSQAFATANDNDFARSAPGVASAAITLGYSGASAGGASQVVVNHRGWALSGAVGSVQVKLYNGASLIATGPAHALGATKANFSDVFAGLAVSDANQLRTELDFTNTSGGSTSLGTTVVWIDVTPASHELLHAAYPDAFVSNATGLPVRLNGFNLRATGSGGWAVPAAHFAEIKAKGFNMMRLAMSWNDYEPARGQFSASALAALDQTIASCKAAGLYVILDPIHANSGPKFPPWAVQASDTQDFQTVGREAIPYLQLIAARYASEPQVVAIDLLNEPQLHAIDSATLFGGYNALMAAVRPLVPNKILVVEPISGNVDARKLDFSLLADKANVVYSLHYYYAGGDDDGYSTAGWATAGNFTWNGTAGYPTRSPSQLAAHLAVTLDVMQSVRLPVWIGEYGIGTGVTQHDAWFQDVVALFDAHNLSRTLWEYHWSTMSAVDNSYAWYAWVPLLLQ